MHNVRRLSQALSNEITRRCEEKHGVIIGYDRRFLSKQAAEASSEIFAGNNIPTILLSEDAPTPLITYATAREGSAYGLVFTASHNPLEWNGLKVFHSDGALLLDDETRHIETETNALTPGDVIKLELDLALEDGIVRHKDYNNEYVDAVESLIDLEAIRKDGLKVIVDPMYGVGQLTLGTVLTEARCRVTFIHEHHHPLFGGRSPAPSLEGLRMLSSQMKEDGYDVGLTMDGDADRIAILDEQGRYSSVNDLLLLLYWYLHEVRGERGGVVRNFSTTHLLDRPGHYKYLRDDDTGEYWSVSWQPVGKNLDQARYECRHGLSYSKFTCDYQNIHAEQTLFIPLDDDVELWDLKIRNTGVKPHRSGLPRHFTGCDERGPHQSSKMPPAHRGIAEGASQPGLRSALVRSRLV
jgi:phosphoglucomutase